MRRKQMQDVLAAFVADCGYESVRQMLEKIRPTVIVGGKNPAPVVVKQPAKPRARKNTVAVVKSLKLDDEEKRRMLTVLAEKYDAKTFIPHVGSARAFLEREGADISRVKSRQQVTVAIFKRLAGWETERLREMDDGGWYAPHEGLAPIAEAIENFARQRRL